MSTEGVGMIGLAMTEGAKGLLEGRREAKQADLAEEQTIANRKKARAEASLREEELYEKQAWRTGGGLQTQQDAEIARLKQDAAQNNQKFNLIKRENTNRAIFQYNKDGGNVNRLATLFRDHQDIRESIAGAGGVIAHMENLDYDDPENAGLVRQIETTFGELPKGETEPVKHMDTEQPLTYQEPVSPRSGIRDVASEYTINRDKFKKRFIKMKIVKGDGTQETVVRDMRDLMSSMNYGEYVTNKEFAETLAELNVREKTADVGKKEIELEQMQRTGVDPLDKSRAASEKRIKDVKGREYVKLKADFLTKKELSDEQFNTMVRYAPTAKIADDLHYLKNARTLNATKYLQDDPSKVEATGEVNLALREMDRQEKFTPDQLKTIGLMREVATLGTEAGGITEATTGIITETLNNLVATAVDSQDPKTATVSKAREQLNLVLIRINSGLAMTESELTRNETALGIKKGLNTALAGLKTALGAKLSGIEALKKRYPYQFHKLYGDKYEQLTKVVYGLERSLYYNSQKGKHKAKVAKTLEKYPPYVPYAYNTKIEAQQEEASGATKEAPVPKATELSTQKEQELDAILGGI